MASSRLERIGTIFTRKQASDRLLEMLIEVIDQLHTDLDALKDNQQKLEELVAALLKSIQQTTTAHELKMNSLKEICSAFKKECNELDQDHRRQSSQLASELEADVKSLQEELVSETKRRGWETLRNTIYHAMHDDLVNE